MSALPECWVKLMHSYHNENKTITLQARDYISLVLKLLYKQHGGPRGTNYAPSYNIQRNRRNKNKIWKHTEVQSSALSSPICSLNSLFFGFSYFNRGIRSQIQLVSIGRRP
jgi:hypothetical protein